MIEVELSQETHKPGLGSSPDLQPSDLSLRMRLGGRAHMWKPHTDVYEVEDALVVRMEIAGMREADFSIVYDGRFLMIHGTRSEAPEKRAFYQMEVPFGEFGVDIELPYAVEAGGIEAFYSNGFLRIVLPKARPQKVSVEEQYS
jgi:HSP20 family protein